MHSCPFVGLARIIYTVYIRYFGQGNHQIYSHIRQMLFTVLANPTLVALCKRPSFLH